MKIHLPASLALFAAMSSTPCAHACSACAALATPAPGAAPAAESSAGANPSTPAGHPLRGVVVDILPDKQALLVKHEEIPGVMKAMTMLLQVDAAVLTAVTKGQRIEALLVETDDGWRLDRVKPLPSEP
jgi:Cu/Ag efflux protein CusF